MKERGMIFNGEMVRAILDGRKTQTRRTVKFPVHDKNLGYELAGNELAGELSAGNYLNSAFGKPGDRIWVRETWGVVSHELDEDGRIQPWMPDRPATAIHEMPFGNGYYSGYAIYAADGDFTWGDDDGYEDGRSCWKPSIHMPKAASRILLEITDVRVERLNAISEKDATAEGVPPAGSLLPDYPGTFLTLKGDFATAKVAFQRLWESIYGAENWQANPWVWVIEFKRVEGGAA
ncbi:morphogenetic protein [Klebsiella variicola]|uniref:morphogenetic protein n=1 Tax=Klebsiella variicola TaxID=244366 RepID=UPI001560F2D1|nr:morphogenetic protein [Klebsiella variicola]NRG07203.1 morphogenetic protein [Klebsiella variicola]